MIYRQCIDCAYLRREVFTGAHTCLYNGEDRKIDLVSGSYAVTDCKDLRAQGDGKCGTNAEWFIYASAVPSEPLPTWLLEPTPPQPEGKITKFFRELFANIF